MAQNIYDKPEFFKGYSGLARSVHGLDGAPEWPAIRALLPGLADRHVVDLGCGFGSLAFHYVEDFGRLAGTIFRSLRPQAGFVFTIEHPIYMASTRPKWLSAPDGGRTWPVDHYAVEGERRTNWFAKDVLKYHRRLATTVNTLIDAGFAIQRLVEWSPTAEEVERQHDLADEIERPMMLIVSAGK